MLPIVTGNKLLERKFDTVKFENCSDDAPTLVQNSAGAKFLITIPQGIRNMLAILCSKPLATNIPIGKISAKSLSISVRPA